MLPLEAGVVVDDTRNILVMETHYDNPGGESGSVDSSGVRLHFTDTMRKFEASSLITADAFVTLGGEKVKNNFEYEFTCPSACTNKFSESINVFSSFLHMHTTGREIYSNKFDEDNKFVENINKVCTATQSLLG